MLLKMISIVVLSLIFCCFDIVSGTLEVSNQTESKQVKSFRCDYTYFEEADGYLKFHEIPANFEEARLRCHLEGSILASPINKGLQSAIRKLLKQNGKVILTGIHATFSSGDFFSIEGVPLSKIPHEWAPNEPYNFKNSEKCITLMHNGKMNDVNCHVLYPYACYKKGNNKELNACGTSDNEYQLDSRTSSCYKFHRIPRTWSRAFMTCAAEDGHLAILNSETEAVVIRELFAKNPGNVIQGNVNKEAAFVGVHDWNEHGEFLTIHAMNESTNMLIPRYIGQTLKEAGYDKFSPGEPNNASTGQFCGAVYRSAMFDDVGCENRYAFICEKNPTDVCL